MQNKFCVVLLRTNYTGIILLQLSAGSNKITSNNTTVTLHGVLFSNR